MLRKIDCLLVYLTLLINVSFLYVCVSVHEGVNQQNKKRANYLFFESKESNSFTQPKCLVKITNN